jgi:hypothetical protein
MLKQNSPLLGKRKRGKDESEESESQEEEIYDNIEDSQDELDHL